MGKRNKVYSIDELLNDKIPQHEINALIRETQQKPIPRMEELPMERILHWNHYTCRTCKSHYHCPGSVPQPVFIKTKLLKYRNLTTQQLADLPHQSVVQDPITGEVFADKLDNPWNPTDLPLRIENHYYNVDRCINCVSGKHYVENQLELFGDE